MFVLIALLAVFSCSKKETTQTDLCQGVFCDNGGICQNGDCQCAPGWTGPACQQEKVPVKMKVATVTLTDFPLVDSNGASWDLADGADQYIIISKGGTTLYTSGYAVNGKAPLAFTPNFEFSDPTATYAISVYDHDDFGTDDFMGGITFTPYRSGAKFPTNYTLTCGNCVVSFDFTGIVYYH